MLAVSLELRSDPKDEMAYTLGLALALMMTACIPDASATKACAGSGSATACKACCRANGDHDYVFHFTSTKNTCMCEFSSSTTTR